MKDTAATPTYSATSAALLLQTMQALPRQEVDDTVGAVGWRGDAFAQRVAGVDPADVAILTRMRIEATGTQHISEESTVILSEYAALLLEVAPRLEGYEADVRFEFCWCHAFNEAQSIASSSVYFELACVLWNVGSSYAALGLDEPRDSMEGLIAAQTHFEYAAGVLCCLKESVLPRIMGRSFPHFSEAGIQFAINLMLAQAQYANYLSLVHLLAIGEIDVPPATVASVASRVSYFYLRAYSYSLQIPFVKVLDPKWSNILKFCIKTTAGYAEFHQARSVMDLAQATGAGYGEVVARLMRALRLLKDASVMDAGSTLSIHEMECTVLQIIVQVEQTLVIAINDFDTSTDQSSVPGELELRPVDGVTVITIRNPLHDIVFATKRFSGVVSRYVTDLADHFKARVQSLVNTVVIEANQATNLASSLLSDIGLPGSLETFKQGGQLSDNLWGKIKKIQMLGGADNILRHQDAMNSKANDAIKAIDELRDCLEAEHHRDNAFRLTHPMWISTDTLPAIVDMTASCLEMRDMAYAARMSDGALTEDLHSASLTNALKVLAMPRHEVAALLPCGQSGAKPKMNKWSMWSFNILEGALNHIDDLLLARSKMVGHLLGRAEADFTDDLKDCLADGLTGEEAEDKLFLVFQNLAKAISESTATQPSILDAVVHANMAFIEARDSDPDAIEMNRVVAQLEQCVCSYYKTLSQLMEGDSFYEGMQVCNCPSACARFQLTHISVYGCSTWCQCSCIRLATHCTPWSCNDLTTTLRLPS